MTNSEQKLMRRADILQGMVDLVLNEMKAVYDETMAVAERQRQSPDQVVGELIRVELADKRARSIQYRLTAAKLPLRKEIDDFVFADSVLDEARKLVASSFLEPLAMSF